jgi:hypothetical protein
MKSKILLPFLLTACATALAADPNVTVACYYFGNYHPGDPRNDKQKGNAWSEWELVKAARPRFPGHHQPNEPLWGYSDESDPEVMAQKIDAAADHGIDAFIFDWYYYNDGPFLDSTIDHGFLHAQNSKRLKFALMWANHDWQDIFPYRKGTPRRVLYPGKVTPKTFDIICDHVIRDYFTRENYWRIDECPYFSIYDLSKLLEDFGGVEATRAALDRFRAKARAAGFPDLHLNAIVAGKVALPGGKSSVAPSDIIGDLGFNSVTDYVWVHHVMLESQANPYEAVADLYMQYWTQAQKKFRVPYFPNVTMGWDPSPRMDQRDKLDNSGYPFTNVITGNTPERFKAALEKVDDRLRNRESGPRVLTINAWNEWTEGSYLEPDKVNGMGYLDAIRDVFGSAKHGISQ